MMRFLATASIAAMMCLSAPALGQTAAELGAVTQEEWNIYKSGFVTPEGRVVDDANGGISHSEGQGYGLLLSFLADDRDTFQSIWSFTRDNLMVRGDDLAAWRWSPDADPHITDSNNASDGDILIAYALALAGRAWGEQDLVDQAKKTAEAVGKTSTQRWQGMELLLPGQFGFRKEDRKDGPVINLSYWIFEAFPVLSQVAPSVTWDRMATDGRRLIAAARFGDADLPTDWVALAGEQPAPAEGFPAEFGYNSIRIPLYLLRAGESQAALLEPFARLWSAGPATIGLPDGDVIDPLEEVGYRAIGAAMNCVLYDTPLPDDVKVFSQQSYYGSTLHLLVLSHLRAHAPQCL
jgi:endoglucanase